VFYFLTAFILVIVGHFVLKQVETFKLPEETDEEDPDWKDEYTEEEEVE